MHYLYFVDGEPYLGDVKAYAEALKHQHYGAIAVSEVVYNVQENPFRVEVIIPRTEGYNTDNDYRNLRVLIEDEYADIRIDLRA